MQQEADSIAALLADTDAATADIEVPQESAYLFTFDKYKYGVDAGASVSIPFSLPEKSTVEVIAKDGWSATVTMDTDVSGVIVVTAPDPAEYADLVAVATAEDGKQVATILNLMVRDPFSDDTRPYINALGYYSFKPAQATLENFQKLVDAGIKSVTLECDDYNWKEQLELIIEAGLQVLPVIGYYGEQYYKYLDAYDGLDEVVNYLKDKPGVLAYHICDEPSVDKVYELMCIKDKIESLDPVHPVYVNLGPDASRSFLGTEYYPDYIECYAGLCGLKLLSFDIYPILPGGIQKSWYKCLDTVSKAAQSHNVPFWSFAASCWINKETTLRERPTVENLRLQVYHNLCYGAQVVQYFTICSYSGTSLAPMMAYTDQWTDAYDVLKDFNLEMLRRSYVFAGCRVNRLRHTNFMTAWGQQISVQDYPEVMTSLVTSSDALVSFIENRGSEYVVIANKSWTEKITAEVEFTDMIYTIDRDGTFTERQPGTTSVTIDEGDMLVIKYR